MPRPAYGRLNYDDATYSEGKGMQMSGSVRSAWRLSAPVTDAIHLQTVPSVSLLAAAHIRFNSARPWPDKAAARGQRRQSAEMCWYRISYAGQKV